MRTRGMPCHPTYLTERMMDIIRSLPSDEFSVSELHALMPDCARSSLWPALTKKVAHGCLVRSGRGRFRVVHRTKRHQNLPLGVVVEAVWAVLSTDPQRRFMSRADIVAEAEAYLGRPGVSLMRSVSGPLTYWHRDGFLERIGSRRDYRFRLREGVTERPVLTA